MYRIILVLLWILVWIPPVHGDAIERNLAYGEGFMEREEWFRAGTEFMKAAMAATGPTAQSAWVRAGDAHLHARQWERAVNLYSEARAHPGPLANLARFRMGQSYYLGDEYTLAEAILSELGDVTPADALAVEANVYRSLGALQQGRFDRAGRLYGRLADMVDDETQQQRLLELAEATRGVNELPSRSPLAAALMSAVIPGAGQVYTGAWHEAGLAITVNAVFGLLIWDSVLKARGFSEDPFGGWPYTTTALYSFVGSSFYFGNIYGAAASAQRFNRRQVDDLRGELKDETIRLRLLELDLN